MCNTVQKIITRSSKQSFRESETAFNKRKNSVQNNERVLRLFCIQNINTEIASGANIRMKHVCLQSLPRCNFSVFAKKDNWRIFETEKPHVCTRSLYSGKLFCKQLFPRVVSLDGFP